MPHGLNYPLFVPDSCSEIVVLIRSGRIADAVERVARKADFGDEDAAALLAYIALRSADHATNQQLIGSHLRKAAQNGVPFAEFVMALVQRASDNEPQAIEWMRRAVNHLFPPALAHMGRFMAIGYGFPAPARDEAWKLYKLALKRKHVPTLGFVVDLLRTSPNVAIRVLGILLLPVAVSATSVHFILRPFSVRSFVHVNNPSLPLFTKTR
jgi:hypothetical protein